VFEQHADNVSLKTEAACVRMPAHDVVSSMEMQPVVIVYSVAADEINEICISVGQPLSKGAFAFNTAVVWNG
jgi:hypothetical protein